MKKFMNVVGFVLAACVAYAGAGACFYAGTWLFIHAFLGAK